VKKDTVLSIDLDYWRTVTPTMLSFLRKCLALNVPKVLTKFHHQLLPFVNKHRASILINIDYHADFCEDDRNKHNRIILPELNCGTWVNHVKWRKQGTFIWVCPNKKDCYEQGEGRCDSSRDHETDPFVNDNNGWHRREIRVGLKGIDLQRVKAIGFALSPDYIWTRVRRNYDQIQNVMPQLQDEWIENEHQEDERVFKV
jgi:hypothetical protein